VAKFNIRQAFNNKKFKYGGYATLMTAIVLASVIILNLIMEMEGLNKKFDLTANKFFTLSEESKKLLKDVNKKVNIIGLYEQGQDDNFTRQIKEFLNQYKDSSGNIDIQYIDTDLQPTFVTKYKEGKDIAENSLIVESGSKYKIIGQYDLVEVDYSNPYAEPQVTSVIAEQAITSAILYVTSEKNPVIYTLIGHEEGELSPDLNQYVTDENYTVKKLNILTEKWVPQVGDVLLINAPQRDLSEDELNKIKSYMDKGGRIIYFAAFTEKELPNFNSLLNAYGVKVTRGLVIEGDSGYMYQDPLNLVPEFTYQEIVSPIKSSNLYVLITAAMPIEEVEGKKDTIRVESLLETSSKSYARVDLNNSVISKQEGDLSGPFKVAVAVTDEVDASNSEKNGKLVVFSSSSVMATEAIQLSNGANLDLFLNSLSWLAERKENLIIRPKSLQLESLEMTNSQAYTISAIAVVIIPLLITASGIMVWLRRRHL
jgi:ABC-type uncharacterized transport system involved in gliding motility auxiliary subunit